MTKEQQQSIEDIQGTAGMRTIQMLIEEKMRKVDSVRGINKDGLVEAQALARQLTYEVLEEFFREIKLMPSSEQTERRTYE